MSTESHAAVCDAVEASLVDFIKLLRTIGDEPATKAKLFRALAGVCNLSADVYDTQSIIEGLVQ